MVRVIKSGGRSVEEVLSSVEPDSEIVFWISRHNLTEEQKTAISDLHHPDAIVIHLNNIDFKGLGHFARLVDLCSRTGMVYIVPIRKPVDYISEVCRGNCGHLRFRTFGGYSNRRGGTFVFFCIYEVSVGHNEIIYKPCQTSRKQQLALV